MSNLRCRDLDLPGRLRRRPDQSEEEPLGEGGERLHDWVVGSAPGASPTSQHGGEVNESTPDHRGIAGERRRG